jgi:hypothetical protein
LTLHRKILQGIVHSLLGQSCAYVKRDACGSHEYPRLLCKHISVYFLNQRRSKVTILITAHIYIYSVLVRLKEILVENLTNTANLYPNFLCVVSDAAKPSIDHCMGENSALTSEVKECDRDMVSIQVEQFSELETDYPGFVGSLSGRMQGIRVYFCMRFVRELESFFTAGPIAALVNLIAKQQAVATSTESYQRRSSLAQTVDPSLKRLPMMKTSSPKPSVEFNCADQFNGPPLLSLETTKAPDLTAATVSPAPAFFQLDLRLRDVEVCVPQSSHRSEIIEARIDEITITTSQEQESDSASSMTLVAGSTNSSPKYMKVQATLERAHLVTRLPHVSKLVVVSKQTIDISLISHRNKIVLNADMTDIDCRLSQRDLALILSVSRGNLAEMARAVVWEGKTDSKVDESVVKKARAEFEEKKREAEQAAKRKAEALAFSQQLSIDFILHRVNGRLFLSEPTEEAFMSSSLCQVHARIEKGGDDSVSFLASVGLALVLCTVYL